jgi:hypothetical protein
VYKQTLRSVKLTTGKKGKKTELTGKEPLRRRRSALDCSATEDEEGFNRKCMCWYSVYSGFLCFEIFMWLGMSLGNIPEQSVNDNVWIQERERGMKMKKIT